jgi:hypothetical protein
MANRPQSLSKGQREEVEELVSSSQDHIEKRLTGRVAKIVSATVFILSVVFGVSLWQIKKMVEEELRKHLAESIKKEFKTERIKQTVTEVAKERATELLRNEIDPNIEEFKRDLAKRNIEAEGRLTQLMNLVGEARTITDKIQQQSELMQTVIDAQTDDREAFDRLEVWSKDPSHPFHEVALRAWEAVLGEGLMQIRVPPPDVQWNPLWHPEAKSFAQLREHYYGATPKFDKRSMIRYIWERTDFPLLLRLDFLMGIIRQESSIAIAEQAALYFREGTKLKIKPRAFTYFSDWWRDNRKVFEEKDKIKWLPSGN